MPTPNKRTLDFLKLQGYQAETVERWNHFARVRKDLFGFIDIVAIGNGETVGVQATSRSNLSKRKKKILTDCRDAAFQWLSSGNRILLVGWQKNEKINRWEHKTINIELEEFKT